MTDQQEEAQNRRSPGREPDNPALLLKRRRLELSRTDILRQMQAARVEAHREMLRRALDALEKELAGMA